MPNREEFDKVVKMLEGKEDPYVADIEKALGRKITLSDLAFVGISCAFAGVKSGAKMKAKEEKAKADGRGEEKKERAGAVARAEVAVRFSIDGRIATVKVVGGDEGLEGDGELLFNRRTVRSVARRLTDELERAYDANWFRRAIEEAQAGVRDEQKGRA